MQRKTLAAPAFLLIFLLGMLESGGVWADPAAEGAAIVHNGVKPAVPACESCHSAGAGTFPLLDGQVQEYIVRQLGDFRSGMRSHPVMAPIAKALTEQQVNAVAEHYSKQTRRKAPGASAPLEVLQRGVELAVSGDPDINVTACDTCHGQYGKGADFPALAGQNAAYLAAQIKSFREGKRTTDPMGMMQAIAKQLRDEDIDAVSSFYHEVMELEDRIVIE